MPPNKIPISLGIETVGGIFTTVVDKHTLLPVKKSKIFTTAKDNQTIIEIHILKGESQKAINNLSIGKFELSGILPQPKGVPKIDVIFDINASGVALVSAKDILTRNTKSITIIDMVGLKRPKVVVVGSTGTGKTTLFNALFGTQLMPTLCRSDVTDKIAKITLKTGLILYDTPGIHGRNDIYGNITREFIGLPQKNHEYGRTLKKYEKIPFCDLDSTKRCPYRNEIKNVLESLPE